ncbi:NusA-like transcription termination signal-binding factor [archaeon]|nr:NusA-like transcription termination signal-binding factor [archaeon]|tara:strand:+ start:21 stop:425 length:405 start_codon:yes stop_codon:yes gene_type:complete
MNLKLSMEDLEKINFFNNLTRSGVIDCVDDEDEIYFIVPKGKYGLAVGKNGAKIKNAENRFKKTIRLFEFADNVREFAKNMVPDAVNIRVNDDVVIIEVKTKDRAKVIGRSGKNIDIIKRFLNRHFGVKDVKVR